MTGQAAPHPHQHPLQEGAGGPGGEGLGTGKCPLIVVLFSLVGAASPWGRWRWRRYNCARGEQGGGQERDIISLLCWWVGVGDNNVPLSSRELTIQSCHPVVITGSQAPVIMSWAILVMMLVVTSLISLTWKIRIMMVTFRQPKQERFGRFRYH